MAVSKSKSKTFIINKRIILPLVDHSAQDCVAGKKIAVFGPIDHGLATYDVFYQAEKML